MILQGDALTMLRTLPDESVQCCITSPPYWGLRDYGTATWEGGNPKCEHKLGRNGSGRADGVVDDRGQRNRDGVAALTQKVCPHCGAVRIDAQLGLERTPDEYVARLVEVFREVKRVLRSDGTCWIVIGDSYASGKGTCFNPGGGENSLGQERKAAGVHPLDRGSVTGLRDIGLKPKDLVGIPWRVAFALQADGWWLRSDIIWAKPNPMPESVTDRPTKAHEYVFLLTKSARYFWDAESVKEGNNIQTRKAGHTAGSLGIGGQDGRRALGFATTDVTTVGRNLRTVWTIATQPYPEAHFATFPPKLVEPCIKAGTSERGCCPKCGKPWVRVVEKQTRFEGGSGKAGRTSEEINASGKWAGIQYGENIKLGPVVESTTTGWHPACACDAGDPAPCVVLDPFLGSGTTLAVAANLGREGIGIELNPEYVKLAEKRIRKVQRPLPLTVEVR